jgi:hypothetical protein
LVVFYLVHLQRSAYRLPLGNRFLRLLTCAALMALSLRWLDFLPVVLGAGISLLVYAGALFVFRLLVREDLILVRRIFSPPQTLSSLY